MLGRTYRHVNRYIEILKVLIKYGFEDLVSHTSLKNVISFGRKIGIKKINPAVFSLSRWERIRMVFEELGPTFIKFGQIMSIRPDLIPIELASELKKLQDSVTPFSEAEAIETLEKELGKSISDIFQMFDNTPVAAASLAQVHKAVLKEGQTVAVKIQRPDIEKKIEIDLEIMYNIASILEKYFDELKYFNLIKIVEEFDKAIHKELNFLNELSNIERFANNFKNDQTIYVPKVFKNYCSRKILVMEYVEGIKFSEITSIEKINCNKRVLSKNITNIFLKQIFEYKFFHADPHPGNILLLSNNVICFVDYGMMGTLTETSKNLIITALKGVISEDINKISRSILRICEVRGEVNIKKLESNISELIDKYYFKPLYQIDLSELMNDIIKFFPENNIKIPSDLYLLGRSIIILQSIIRNLNEEFNVIKEIEPYIKKLIKEQFSIYKLSKDFFNSFEEFIELGKDFPYEIREILEKIKSGKIKLDIEHKGLNPIIQSYERTSNRITISIILASIIIGSSLIIHSKLPPLWNNIPVIGLIGFLVATILGFVLLISIFRHNKL